MLAELIGSIVVQEGPVHQDEVARRVASIFGKERAGNRIQDAVARALRSRQSGPLIHKAGFWMTQGQIEETRVRDRSNAPQALKKPDMLPPIEIQAAIRLAIRQNGALSDAELAVVVARLFGFQRTSVELQFAILREKEALEIENV